MVACGSTGGPAEAPLEERITRVENGLGPAIRIAGGPRWTLAERMQSYNVPGVSIAVLDQGEVVWEQGYGVASVDDGEPITESTLFQAASISKPVTAAVAMRLVEDGVLDLDSDVNRWLKSWQVPENQFTSEEKVTLRRILSHSAGLTVHGFRGYAPDEPVPDIIQVLDGEPPSNSAAIRVDQVPGSTTRYSGGGYTVLQLLLEDVTGRPLHELAREMILDPAGMSSSSFRKPLPPLLAERVSVAHTSDGTTAVNHQFLEGGSACCGLWTTSGDLVRLARALQRSFNGEPGAILGRAAAEAMLSPSGSPGWGLGFALAGGNGSFYFQHSGGNPPGFSCLLVAHRSRGQAAAVMTNGNNGGRLCREIIQTVAVEFGWDGYLPREYASGDQLLEELQRLRSESPDHPRISELSLNQLGYQLLQSEQHELAVQVFRLNTQLYPRSANCFDSLGDGQVAAGDPASALQSYRKALAVLDKYPEDNTANPQLQEITSRKIEELEQQETQPELS
jgi:CubicO group peptidase (beta-lactamase class C family)